MAKEKNDQKLLEDQKKLTEICVNIQRYFDEKIAPLRESSRKEIRDGLDALLAGIPKCKSSEEISQLLDTFEQICNEACLHKKNSAIVLDIFQCVSAWLAIALITTCGVLAGAGLGGFLGPITAGIGGTVGGMGAFGMALDLCGEYCQPKTVSYKDTLRYMRDVVEAPANSYRESQQAEPQTELKEGETHDDVTPDESSTLPSLN